MLPAFKTKMTSAFVELMFIRKEGKEKILVFAVHMN